MIGLIPKLMRVGGIAAILGTIIGGYLTYQVMDVRINQLKNTHLQRELDRRSAMEDEKEAIRKSVDITNNEVLTSLRDKIGELNGKSNIIVREVERVVPVATECNISRGAVELLNTATEAANNNIRESGVPKTPRLTLEESAAASIIDQRAQIKHQLETIRQCGETRTRYNALIAWIDKTYPKPSEEELE